MGQQKSIFFVICCPLVLNRINALKRGLSHNLVCKRSVFVICLYAVDC